jgi:hypothetical protein
MTYNDSPLDHLKFHETDTSRRIRAMVRAVDQDNAYIGVLSTGEQCAVCLVLDRPDLAKKYLDRTLLDCAERVGPEWLAASLFVQNDWRSGHNDPADDES